MEAEISSDVAVNFSQVAQCYISADGNIHTNCWDHLRSHMEDLLFSVRCYIMYLWLCTYN
jgi:hypothetical protein